MNQTAQQQAILDEMRTGTGHVLIQARAGSGKTTSILMAVDVLRETRPNVEITVCAFNKAIADEIKEKLIKRGHVDFRLTCAATLHSLGFGLIRHAFKPQVDSGKVRGLIRRFAEQNQDGMGGFYNEYQAQIEQLVSLAKQAGVGFFDECPIGDLDVWYALADRYDVNGFDDTNMMDDAVAAAQHVYRSSLKQTNIVDFNDMILFPLIKNVSVKFQRDVIFIDEAQDLSPARQALIRKFLKPTGRMIIVGDDRQAIYGFSGADSDALNHMKMSFNAKLLPLSVTWRCSVAVVNLAQQLVPDIEAAPDANTGVVDNIDELPIDLGPDTAILCRNTAPLIETAYALLRKGVACKVEGRDIGEGLKVLFTRWRVKTLDAFVRKLEVYQEREIQKATAKDKTDRIQTINDKCDTAMAIVEECHSRGLTGVSDAVQFINDLFADGATNVLVLATYHRAKGREWQRVILYEHDVRCPSKYAKQPWQIEQEHNLAYVAFTRAKETLLFYNKKAGA